MPLRVLIIIGAGRSGTTLLGRALGSQAECFNPGELYYVWDAGWRQNQRCSCGEPIRQCPFWTRVFAGEGDVYFERAAELRRTVGFRNRLLCLLFPPLQGEQFRKSLEEYREVLKMLYGRIRTCSASKLIVDCSKDPAHALAVAGCDDIDLYVAHVMREPRAVAFSRSRPKVRTSLETKALMPQESLWSTAIKWNLVNVLCRLVRYRVQHYRVVRYEELVARPEAVLSELMRWAGLTQPLDSEFRLKAESNHVALGNPDRMQSDYLKFALDSRWIRDMSKRDRMLMSLLTWPVRAMSRLW